MLNGVKVYFILYYSKLLTKDVSSLPPLGGLVKINGVLVFSRLHQVTRGGTRRRKLEPEALL